MNATITGMGLWLPKAVRENQAWPASFTEQYVQRSRTDITRVDAPPPDSVGAIMARHAAPFDRDPFRGTKKRHVASGELPSEGEVLAAQRAIDDARVDRCEIDLVLTHSLVPDRLTPPNAALVAHRLGLPNAAGYGLDAVCASFVAQLTLAAALVESGRARNVLVIQSHLVSPTLDLAQPASVLFGDAAAATIVGPAREGYGVLRHVARSDGSMHGAITWQRSDGENLPWYRGGRVFPGSDDRVAVRKLAAGLLNVAVDTMSELLDVSRVPAQDLAAIASIQPFAWYQGALAEALDVDPARVPSTFTEIGHIGAAGVVANALAARDQGLLRDGSLVAFYAHGAGMNRSAVLVRWG